MWVLLGYVVLCEKWKKCIENVWRKKEKKKDEKMFQKFDGFIRKQFNQRSSLCMQSNAGTLPILYTPGKVFLQKWDDQESSDTKNEVTGSKRSSSTQQTASTFTNLCNGPALFPSNDMIIILQSNVKDNSNSCPTKSWQQFVSNLHSSSQHFCTGWLISVWLVGRLFVCWPPIGWHTPSAS
jgi:hypothetical protein